MNAGILFQETCSDRSKQRRGRDSNPRYRFHGTHAFQASPFDHSGTPPFFKQNRKIPVYKSTFNNNCRRSSGVIQFFKSFSSRDTLFICPNTAQGYEEQAAERSRGSGTSPGIDWFGGGGLPKAYSLQNLKWLASQHLNLIAEKKGEYQYLSRETDT
jgi:hypothetical protein